VKFLLDTNTVSEWVKPRPNVGVIAWMDSIDDDLVFLSVVSLAEVRYGIERLAHGNRRRQLEEWLELELPLRFEDRILPVDAGIANAWGKIVSSGEAAGRPVAAMDAFLAATAEVHRLTLVTRNTSHFSFLKTVVNPWSESSSESSS
jgi:predicted nucleic acid-binding protein